MNPNVHEPVRAGFASMLGFARRAASRACVARMGTLVALLSACQGGISDLPEPLGVSALNFDPPRSIADGKSVVKLEVRVDSAAPPSDGKVLLTTTVGTFLGGTTTITISLEPGGLGFAQLKAPDAAGVAKISATAAGVTRYFEVTFDAAVPVAQTKGILGIVTSPTASVADATSLVTFKVIVDTLPRPSPNVVALSTTAGTFAGTNSATTVNVPVNDSGYAYARLRAPAEPGTALVTATVGSSVRQSEIVFAPAPPESVLLSGDFAVKAGALNSAAISALLLRATGAPSSGVSVQFSADTVGGKSGDFGAFSPRTATSTSSTVLTRFTAGETSYRGDVTIRVRGMRGAVVVRDSVTVRVVNP